MNATPRGISLQEVSTAVTGECGASVPGKPLWRTAEGVEVLLEFNAGVITVVIRLGPDREQHRQAITARAELVACVQSIRMARRLAGIDSRQRGEPSGEMR